jgi:hypothetical protein
MLPDVRAIPTALLMLVLGSATGCTDRERSEASLLVDRANAIDPYADADERRERVAALEALGLESTEARAVRDACVEAHGKLLEAEDASAQAKEVVAKAERGEATLTAEQAGDVGRTIERSNEALLTASELLPRCQARVAELASRHGLRR